MKLKPFYTSLEKLSPSIIQLSIDAPISYKIYSIPKKNGGRRIIAHPSKSLKKVQRELLTLFTEYLKIHESASAYIKGKSIINNAEPHKYNKYLLKLDFYDFFNSINSTIFIDYLEKIGITLNEEDKKLVSHIFFWNPNKKDKTHKTLILSVGAPSSPFISNAIMYFFDDKIKRYCDSISMIYTRYADDISISGNNKDDLKNVVPFIRATLDELFDGKIILNELKTTFITSGYNKFITGITLTPQGILSIGRKRKRYIFSLVYKFINNELTEDLIAHMKGLIAFSNSVEPAFIKRLESKYGKENIKRIINGK